MLLAACGTAPASTATHTPTPTATPQPQAAETPDAALGELIYQQYGCNACHSTDGSALVGPTWLGLYGTEEPLSDGSAITVDIEYIIESIKDPNAKIVEGYTGGLMPATLGVKDDEILHIIEYMKSLR